MNDIPEFKNDEEAALWFDTHDTADQMKLMDTAEIPFKVVRTYFPTRPVDVRVRSDYLDAIQQVAERQGIPYQMLVQRWLLEKLNQEAPDLI